MSKRYGSRSRIYQNLTQRQHQNYYVAFLRVTTVKAAAIVTAGETPSDKVEQHK